MAPPTFEQWIEREPRLSMLISTMLNVGCTDQQIATTVPVLCMLLEDGVPLAAPPAMSAPAPAVAPATVQASATPAPTPIVTAAPKPKPTLVLLSPTRAEPPKRRPFEKALNTIIGSSPSGPWSLDEAPKQSADAPTAPTRKPFEKALQTVCGPKPTMAKPWSLPDGAA